MNVFFDNCTAPVLASTLHGYITHRDTLHTISATYHAAHLPADVIWINMLGASKEDWIVITGDGRIERNKPERAAFRQAMLKGFVLAPSYQKTPLHQTASILIWRWPDMERLIQSVAAPALYELP